MQAAPEMAERSSLPVKGAFVVQFRAETDSEQGPFAGRVEHVASGQAAPFHSPEELLAFMARLRRGGLRKTRKTDAPARC